MSLKHDPSAIRYASTQEAYGQIWTLDKVEPDGAQVWKNGKGQTAMVQAEPVSKLPLSPVWVLTDPSTANVPVVRHPIKDDRATLKSAVTYDRCLTADEIIKVYNEGPDAIPGGHKINDLTDPTNEETIAEIDRLIASGRAGKYAKTLEDCKQAMQSGRVSSTEENASNMPVSKDDTIEISLDLVKRAMYLSPVDLAIRARDAKRKPGEQRISADGQKRWTWNGSWWDKS